MARIPESPAWEIAAEASRSRLAISSRPIKVRFPKFSYDMLVDIVKPRHGDAYAVYHSAVGIKIPFTMFRPSAADIDRVRTWKAY